MSPTKSPTSKPQVDKFRDLARQLECDEDEEAFKAKVVKVARAPRATGKRTNDDG